MYCRTCGNKVNDNAEICVKCGCRPLIGKAFCQNCGAKTLAQQAVCTKCGISLKSVAVAKTTKGTADNAALKIIGNALIGIGIFLFAVTVWHLGAFVLNLQYDEYEAAGHAAYAIKCFLIGLAFVIPGKICKKNSRRK